MKRIAKMLAVCGLLGSTACLLSGCGSKAPANDVDERKIFSGDASKMPDDARKQMEAAVSKGKAGAQASKPTQ